jgi:methionine-rich copper-binding protein CopC
MKPRTLLFAVLSVLALQTAAFAHAFLDHAEPRVGSEVRTSPSEVKVWMSQNVEPAFSTLQVFDANGKEVDGKDFHVDKEDASLLIVSVPTLSAGTYKVVWRVVSVDTHRTSGDFKFTVGK